MPALKRTAKKPSKPEPKRYLEQLPRKWVWGGVGVFAVIALLLFLCVPHYKPLKLATDQQMQQAHQQIIGRYFLASTVCQNDTMTHDQRVAAFNQYFKVNDYANRAVIRGCNDADTLLAKAEGGSWQRTNVNIRLDARQNPSWQKACLIDGITTADTVVRPENASIDAHNLQVCNDLRRQSYIEVHFSIDFHK